VVPYFGDALVKWVWGGFRVGSATLTRFFSLHFLFPFLLIGLVLVHLYFLHTYGSSCYTSIDPWVDKISFFPYYGVKDLFGFFFFFFIFFFFVFLFPYLLGDPENFSVADPLKTPLHIQPE
jgi:ubiquinol-cytochrome c reductase cytochrome b subunit